MTNKSNGAPADYTTLDARRPGSDLGQIRAVSDNLPQLAWSCLPDGHCDYLSRRWVEYTGTPEGLHHGRGWLDAVHPEDRERTDAVWNAFVEGRAEYDVDYRLRRHDGEYRWFKTRGVLLRGEDGSPLRVVGTTTDIDRQKRAQGDLRESRERLDAALSASGTGTFRWDIHTNALDWDEQLDRLFGLPPGKTVRSLEKFVERVHPDDRAGVVERCDHCKDEGADFAMEFRVVWPDGSLHWLDDRGRTFRDRAGKPAYMTGACVDITERKRAEERLRELDERAAFVREASGVGFWYCDLPFDVLEWDERVKEHFHLPPDATVTIHTFYDRIHPDDREPTRQAIERSIAGRHGYDVRYRTVHPATGGEKWVRAIGRTFYAPGGTPRRFDGVTLDVTEERRAEGQLREAEATLRAFFDASPVMMGLVELPEGIDIVHLYDDAVACRFFGVEPGGTTGRRASELGAPPETIAEWRARYLESGTRGVPVRFEYRHAAVNGPRWLSCAVAPIGPGSSGRPRFGYVVEDVTDRKLAEEGLRDADRRKDEFLALLAHELRNPLAPLRNGLQVMRLAGGSGEAADRARGMMERQLAHMVRLIDDLLDVSRISRNKMELRRGRVLLSDVVSSAVETTRPVIDQAGHEFQVALPAEPLYLDCDLTRLAQVFSNLLTNAAKYTQPGGRITLAAEPKGGEVSVSVRDTGIGIPAGSLTTIFDMFSQVDRSIERQTGGLGIGLALVKGLIEMHGGRVTAESDGPGAGSTFRVTLPVLPAVEPPREAEGSGPDAGTRVVSRRVLIVDDNRDSAESMASMLELLGHRVRTAHDGLEALAVADEFRPTLILMDVGMPRMNGYDATRRIREKPWGKGITVIALTGWGQEGDRAESRAAGCDDHLVKPVHLNDLSHFFQ